MNSNLSKKQLRDFGFLIGIGFPFLIGFVIPGLFGHSFRVWTLFVGIPILFLGILQPLKLKFIYKIWISIGNVLGQINSRIILGIIFFLLLQPISLLMKLFGYDPLRKKKVNVFTYREVRPNAKIDLRKIF